MTASEQQPPIKPTLQPSTPLLMLAIFSVVLPYIGIGLGIAGAVVLADSAGNPITGWLLVLAGVACIIADIMIDVVFAHPALSMTDEPTLNRAGVQLIGRTAVVTEPISDGRGKVRIGDTFWMAEGPDQPDGRTVRVTGARDTVLIVEAAEQQT